MQTQWLEPHFGIAPHDSLQSTTVSVAIESMTVGFHPTAPGPLPRLEHIRDLWQMQSTAQAAARTDRGDFQTDTGLELRVGFSETNLIHSELSRTGDAPLLTRAADLRQVLIEQGGSNSSHPRRPNNANATDLGYDVSGGLATSSLSPS